MRIGFLLGYEEVGPQGPGGNVKRVATIGETKKNDILAAGRESSEPSLISARGVE